MRFVVLILFLILQPSVFSAGVIAYKARDYHPNSSARVVLYRELNGFSSGPITVRTHDKVFVIERSLFVSKVEIMEALPSSIVDEKDIADLRNHLQLYRNFIDRFPRSKTLLEGFIEDLQSVISVCDAGKVRFRSEWMSREKLAAIMQSEEQKRKEEYEKAKIIKRQRADFEQSQKDRGLVLYNGAWMPAEDARSLYSKLQEGLQSKANEDLEIQRGKNAQFIEFEVIQVLQDGLIVKLNSSGTLCYLNNIEIDGMFIGANCTCWAVNDGTYNYQTVLGANNTILMKRVINKKYLPTKNK